MSNITTSSIHQAKFESAKRAVKALFDDRTVSTEKTLESLNLIADDLLGWIEGLEEDLDNGL